MMKRVLCVWLPNWPIQRQELVNPTWRGAPIVLQAEMRGALRVTHASTTARQAGVAAGMTVAEAQALLHPAHTGPSPASSPHFVMADPAADRAALAAWGVWCQRYTPHVACEEADCPESLLLDVTGCAGLHLSGSHASELASRSTSTALPSPLAEEQPCDTEAWSSLNGSRASYDENTEPFINTSGSPSTCDPGEQALVSQVMNDFAQLGLTVRVALADTLGAAWAFAHADDRSRHGLVISPLVMGTEEPARSNKASHTGSEAAIAASYALPAWGLRLPPETLRLLRELGLKTVGQLRALPRATLPARFGRELPLRLAQLLGEVAEPLVPLPPPAPIRARRVFDEAVSRHDWLEPIFHELLTELTQHLAPTGQGILEFACLWTGEPRADVSHAGTSVTRRLSHPTRFSNTKSSSASATVPTSESGASVREAQRGEWVIGLYQATLSVPHLWELVRLRLEREPWPAVLAVQLDVTRTGPLGCPVRPLFLNGSGSRSAGQSTEELGRLVDRLACRLGPHTLWRPHLTGDPVPEHAVYWQSCLDTPSRTRSTSPHRGRVQGPPHGLPPVPSTARPFRQRPLRLCGKPLPVRVFTPLCDDAASDAPHTPPGGPRPLVTMAGEPVRSPPSSGFPTAFEYDDEWHTLHIPWGPERIESGWWRHKPIARDYYRLETTTGRQFWLFHDATAQQWFLHGEYT